MVEDAKKESEAPEPQKQKAEDNRWYLLATLYGVPEFDDEELKKRNRIAWNRYYAGRLEETRKQLIAEKHHTEEELTPFSDEELEQIRKDFEARCGVIGKKPPQAIERIDFSNVKFEERWLNFEGFFFGAHVTFENCEFVGFACFRCATFWMAQFKDATFLDSAAFVGAAFWQADFEGVTFSGGAHFLDAVFTSGADFANAKFSFAAFAEAKFQSANFSGALVSGRASFDSVIIEQADFKATFEGQVSFVNAEMKGTTSFEHAQFRRSPPQFFGAKLHEGTVWPGRDAWPLPKTKDEAGDFIHAYERLKLEMDRLKKHEDELNFFALELQSRRVWLGPWAGLPIALYGKLSDYGRDYWRPLIWLFFLGLVPTFGFLTSDAIEPLHTLGFSFASTLNVFGFRKDFFDPQVIAKLPAWLDTLAAAQTILGAILLFLVGLGIRNKFRMK